MEQLIALLPPPKNPEAVESSDKALAVAIIGRPNVGKSSILNSLVSHLISRHSIIPYPHLSCCSTSVQEQMWKAVSINSALSGAKRDLADLRAPERTSLGCCACE
jgi:hypothetical protein